MQKEKKPDDRHNVLQIKEIKLQTKVIHTGRQTPSRLAIPQRPDLNLFSTKSEAHRPWAGNQTGPSRG
ncbi:MAG: hypothetical protein SPF89_09265 [Sphaerochaetaceae bacterium]|nr:hypothetical protein [Spirochaetales bacterium]MDY5500280.1 hypothetical protein [Sphaerochaetaceae bacterium]